jgi:hypothetical protein
MVTLNSIPSLWNVRVGRKRMWSLFYSIREEWNVNKTSNPAEKGRFLDGKF